MMINEIYISDLDMFGLGELPKAYNKVKRKEYLDPSTQIRAKYYNLFYRNNINFYDLGSKSAFLRIFTISVFTHYTKIFRGNCVSF